MKAIYSQHRRHKIPFQCLGVHDRHLTHGDPIHVYGEGPYCGICSKIRMQEIEQARVGHRLQKIIDDIADV